MCGTFLQRIDENGLSKTIRKKPDLISIEYLLDILKSIHEWVSSKFESNNTYDIKAEKTGTPKKAYDKSPSRNYNFDLDFQSVEPPKTPTNIFDDFDKHYAEHNKLEHKPRAFFDEKDFENFKQRQARIDSGLDMHEHRTGSSPRSLLDNYNESDSDDLDFLRQNYRSVKSAREFRPEVQTVNNELKRVRQSLNDNLIIQNTKIKTILETIYDDDLKDAKSMMYQSLQKIKNKSDLTNRLFQSAYNNEKSELNKHTPKVKPNLIITNSSRSKGILLPTNRSLVNVKQMRRCMSARERSTSSKKRTRSLSKTSRDPGQNFVSRFTIGENGILNALLLEFPFLYSSPETIHYLWQKNHKQIETLTNIQKKFENDFINKKTNKIDLVNIDNDKRNEGEAQKYLKESHRKHQMLMDILRKDLTHIQRMQDLKRKQQVENSMKARMREQRFQNAKIKRYSEEFRLQQRSKMLKQATSEELVFKKLFIESLKIQKERMLEIKKYAKEKKK